MVHKVFVELVQQLLVRAQLKNVIYVQRNNDKASVIFEYVNAWVLFERAEHDFGEVIVHRGEPNRQALPETVQT